MILTPLIALLLGERSGFLGVVHLQVIAIDRMGTGNIDNEKRVPRLCPYIMAVGQQNRREEVSRNSDQQDTGMPMLPYSQSLPTPLWEG